jgi:hypothetical protein
LAEAIADPLVILAGMQDTGTALSNGDLTRWNNLPDGVGGGDGGSCVISPGDINQQYATSNFYDNQIGLWFTPDRWLTNQQIVDKSHIMASDPRPVNPAMAVDPYQPNILYVATNYLYRWVYDKNANAGHWVNRLGNLPLKIAGYCLALALTSTDGGLTGNRIYVGSHAPDGGVWMSSDEGNTWRRIDAAIDSGLPAQSVINAIAVNPNDPNDILAGLESNGEGKGLVWRCQDPAADTPQWEDVARQGHVPNGFAGIPVQAVLFDGWDPAQVWYAGTKLGVIFTKDAGGGWRDATRAFGMPHADVSDLKGQFGRAGVGHLTAATLGRGLWRVEIVSRSICLRNVASILGSNCVSGMAQKVGVTGRPICVRDMIRRVH